MICDNWQNKAPERDALIPGSLNGRLSWKITFFETDNARTFRKELKSSRPGDNATRLSPDLYSVPTTTTTIISSIAIVAILLLIKHTVYHLGRCRNGLSIKTTSLPPYLLVASPAEEELLMKYGTGELRVSPIDVLRSQLFPPPYLPESSSVITFPHCIIWIVMSDNTIGDYFCSLK